MRKETKMLAKYSNYLKSHKNSRVNLLLCCVWYKSAKFTEVKIYFVSTALLNYLQ